MVWETDNNARQRWCTRLWQGGALSSPLFDDFDNLYVGQPGAIMSYPPTQWIRWRQPVIGMPTTPRLLAPGQLLVLTHLGQVLVFDAHKGTVVGTSLDLVAGVDPTDSDRGLADCATGPPGVPDLGRTRVRRADRRRGGRAVGTGRGGTRAGRPAVPAGSDPDPEPRMDQRRGRRRSRRQPGVVGRTGPPPTSTAATGGCGPSTPPTARAKWSVELGYQPQTPPSVSAGGVIVAGGGPGARLTGISDTGEIVWTRADVEPLSTSSRAGEDTGYTVVRDGAAARRYWCSTPSRAPPSTATHCRRPPAGRSGCRSATTAGWSPRPATARFAGFAPA